MVSVYGLLQRLPKRLQRRLIRLSAPAYTVCAVVLLRDDAGRLLLLRQPGRQGWSLPGGLLDKGESPLAAAARELAEETGVRLPVTALRSAEPAVLFSPAIRYVTCVFEADAPLDVRVDGGSDEVLDAGWFDLCSLPRLTRATEFCLAYCLAAGPTTGVTSVAMVLASAREFEDG